MKFIEITRTTAVNTNSIDRITRDESGLARVHIGLDEIITMFPYEALLSLIGMDAPERGVGPLPTDTAMTY